MRGLSVVLDYPPLGFIAGVVRNVHAHGMVLAPLPVRVPLGAAVGVVVVQGGQVVARLQARAYGRGGGVELAVVAGDLPAWQRIGMSDVQPQLQLLVPGVLGRVRRPRALSALRL